MYDCSIRNSLTCTSTSCFYCINTNDCGSSFFPPEGQWTCYDYYLDGCPSGMPTVTSHGIYTP